MLTYHEKVMQYLPWSYFVGDIQDINIQNEFENYIFEITATSFWDQPVKGFTKIHSVSYIQGV